MRKLNIEVHEDSGRPGGGHAVIRLIGLDSLPDNVTYRIKPVDTAHHGDAANAWLDGERMPLASRITSQGAELVVGPEVVENPMFLPGTLAVIEIAKCGVRGEFLWPRISPLVRPKRRHLIGARPPREAPADPTPTIQFEEATDASSSIAPLLAPVAEPVLAAKQTVTLDPPPVPAQHALQTTTALATPVAANDAAAPGPLASDRWTSVTDPIAEAVTRTAAASRDVEWRGALTAAPAWSGRRIAAAVAAIGLAIGAFAYMLPGKAPSVASRQLSPTIETHAGEPLPLATLLATGTTSPKGADAAAIPLPKLLEDADANLHGPDGDKKEAAFLLRRYLSGSLSDERTLWALTQLGSLHADPPSGEAADYSKARQLWELASSLGDSVAMCFVASLHEHGLGVNVDRGSALKWLLRAKAAGGCRNIEASIERLQARK